MKNGADTAVKILGTRIDDIALGDLLYLVEQCIFKRNKIVISNVNIHALNISYTLRWFREFLNAGAVTFCDGVGVKIASQLIRHKIAHRYTPPDFIEKIASLAVQHSWKIFFLGAKPGTAKKASEVLLNHFPLLQIDQHHGYFDKSDGSEENDQILSLINKFQPNILFVGFGMPMQERWLLENFDNLSVNIAFPAGALFDYLAGEVVRAPRWMTENGLEWFGRLIVEPRRLWRRYLIGNPLFLWRFFKHHICHIPLPN